MNTSTASSSAQTRIDPREKQLRAEIKRFIAALKLQGYGESLFEHSVSYPGPLIGDEVQPDPNAVPYVRWNSAGTEHAWRGWQAFKSQRTVAYQVKGKDQSEWGPSTSHRIAMDLNKKGYAVRELLVAKEIPGVGK